MKNRYLYYLICMVAILMFTENCKKEESVQTGVPIVTTSEVSAITLTTATCGGNITADGGSSITARGVTWSSNIFFNPVNCPDKTNDGTGIGLFTSNITGLESYVNYYVCAYATNKNGTSFGKIKSFYTEILVGSPYQGGIVAYLYDFLDTGYVFGEVHGFIAAPNDQGKTTRWYNGTYLKTHAIDAGLAAGNANTTTIVNSQGAGNYAAKVCYDLVLNGYSDWYLPSLEQLQKLYENKILIGGFTDNTYWSSSEENLNNAWLIFFNNGSTVNLNKLDPLHVRAVRSF